jgi:hypothetical protein
MSFLEDEGAGAGAGAGAGEVAAALMGMTLEVAGRFSIFCPVIILFSLSWFRYFVTVIAITDGVTLHNGCLKITQHMSQSYN